VGLSTWRSLLVGSAMVLTLAACSDGQRPQAVRESEPDLIQGGTVQATLPPAAAESDASLMAGSVDIFLTGWDARVQEIDGEWTVSFSATFQPIGGSTPGFGVSYAVCERISWCGPETPHHIGSELVFGAQQHAVRGVSTVEGIGPAEELETRSVGGPEVESWRGDDPRGRVFLARFDSTDSVDEDREDNNTIVVFLPPP
jgi:hypothetical protein